MKKRASTVILICSSKNMPLMHQSKWVSPHHNAVNAMHSPSHRDEDVERS